MSPHLQYELENLFIRFIRCTRIALYIFVVIVLGLFFLFLCAFFYLSEPAKSYYEDAKHGDAKAQYELGNCYLYGTGFSSIHSREKMENEALNWFRKSAEQGYAEAQFKLGTLERNEKVAVYWYRLAAQQNNKRAIYKLGKYYDKRRSKEAIKWFLKAVEQGVFSAYFDLGRCYENGDYVEKDLDMAVKYYQKAEEQGVWEASYKLMRLDHK